MKLIKISQRKTSGLGSRTKKVAYSKKKWRWKRLRRKPPTATNQEYKKAKKSDWQTLKLWAEQGLITLLYLDESGCCPESPLCYGYGQIGQQKSISQRTRRGRRINIMGVWEAEQKFEYALKVGTYKTKSYLRFMDWQAERAMKRLFETGKPTVIIQDNASIHRADLVRQRHQLWSRFLYEASYKKADLVKTRVERIFFSSLLS